MVLNWGQFYVLGGNLAMSVDLFCSRVVVAATGKGGLLLAPGG